MARSTARGCLIATVVVVLCVVVAFAAPRIGGIGLKRVGVVPIVGEIVDAHRTIADLKSLADDPTVSAIVLEIDSPGGGVGASQAMYTAIERVKHETGKPVVAAIEDVGASGAYYAACAADTIFAQPGSLTGSIGVIMEYLEYAGAMEKIGVREQVVKSGAVKAAGSPYHSMTDEERQSLQSVVDDSYAQFVEAVSAGRGMEPADVRALADGRAYTGRQARKLGLVDALGDFDDAVRAASRMAGEEGEPHVVRRIHREWKWPWDDVLDQVSRVSSRATRVGPRLLYRLP